MGVIVVDTSKSQVYSDSTYDEVLVSYTGSIDEYGVAAVFSTASNFNLSNAGILFSNIYGVEIRGANSFVSNNPGGSITCSTVAYDAYAASAYLINMGAISGGTEGAHFESAGTRVQNSGTISGATGMYVNVEGDAGVVINSGLISGETNAFYREGGGTLSFRNSGKLDGDVTFVDGANTFDGQKGTVTGVINGGTGIDKILAGNDGETLGGGKGHDRLVGGTGADTFVFSSYSSADSDVVKAFNVADDTIQLDHTVFSHLVADAVPAFAIGTKATSATDFLFYNSGTGNLYYDVDGSKTAHAPFLVANLGTGLKLTASDFSVV